MKKRNICIGIFLGALLLFTAACTPFFDPPETQAAPGAAASGGEGTVVLSINPSGARTLSPEQDEFVKYEVHFYKTTKKAVDIPDIGSVSIIDAYGGGGPYVIQAATEDITTVEKSLTVTKIESIQEALEAGDWQIAVVGYVDVAGTAVASVYGTSTTIKLIAGEVRNISVFLDTPAALDAPGYFEYDITVPSNVTDNYDPNRDAYGDISPGDFIETVARDPDDYFSGAVLRILPDKANLTTPATSFVSDVFDGEYVGLIDNQGKIFIDLNYDDESPGDNGNTRLDRNRLAKGKIELPPGRYTMYLSLVSNRSIDGNSTRTDYIGIFKEEVVYIYPNMTTRTPEVYTTFTNDDLTAQVFFEGYASVANQPTGRTYTPNRVWVSLNNSPSINQDNGHGKWSASIPDATNNGTYEWNLYIPSYEISSALDYSATGQEVYFRFEMSDGTRTLLSPWQQYYTRERQGQVDIDLYAYIETITTPDTTVTITTGAENIIYADTVAKVDDTLVYDVVRGVNFSNSEANKVLFNVTPTVTAGVGRNAIAYFEARTTSDRAIPWRYADSNFSYGGYGYSYPYAANSDTVVYEIDNGESFNNSNKDHEEDNRRVGSNADLGEAPVEITTGYFNFDVTLNLPMDNFPAFDRVRLQVYETSSASFGSPVLLTEKVTTNTTSPFTWTPFIGDELTVFDKNLVDPSYTGPSPSNPEYVPNYTGTDYGIYNYTYGDRNKVELDGYENYDYTNTKGVVFLVLFDDLDAQGNIITSYPLTPTRRYTPPELVNQVKLGIASTYDIPDTVTQTINSVSIDGLRGLTYAPPEQYFYFAALPGDPYYIEYQDQKDTTGGTGLTGSVSVEYYEGLNQKGSISPIRTILPTVPTAPLTRTLVTVVVRGSGGTYKLIKNLSTISPQANAVEFAIPGHDIPGYYTPEYYTWYYTFNASGAAYKLGYRDQSANPTNWVDIQSVSARAYDTDNPNGIYNAGTSAYPNEATGVPSYGSNTLGFINTSNKVLVTVYAPYAPYEGGKFELTLASLATPTLPVTAAGDAAVTYTIARDAVQHFGFTPPNTTATYNFTWDLPAAAGNPATISGVRAYTYTLGTGGLSNATNLTQSTATNLGSPFSANERVLIEVEDGSANDGTRNFTLTVR